jgi:hypothetical protein
MFPEPLGNLVLIYRSTGGADHQGNHLRFIGYDAQSIHPKEDIHCLKGDPLISVHKGMVLCQAHAVGCGEEAEVGLWFILPAVLRSLERRLEQSLVPQTDDTAVLAYLISMDGQNYI